MAKLPETKRQRTEHEKDKGAATDENPQVKAPAPVPADPKAPSA